jgi:hypothetical protein
LRSEKWDRKIEEYWLHNAAEEAFLAYVYHLDPHPTATYVNYVWGADLEDNRHFVFYVSDSRDLACEEFKPRYVAGDDLGPEWDNALVRYWRGRDHVREMRRVSRRLTESGVEPLLWLEEQNDSSRGLYSDDDEEGEHDSNDVPAEQADVAGERRDSGGGKTAGFVSEAT